MIEPDDDSGKSMALASWVSSWNKRDLEDPSIDDNSYQMANIWIGYNDAIINHTFSSIEYRVTLAISHFSDCTFPFHRKRTIHLRVSFKTHYSQWVANGPLASVCTQLTMNVFVHTCRVLMGLFGPLHSVIACGAKDRALSLINRLLTYDSTASNDLGSIVRIRLFHRRSEYRSCTIAIYCMGSWQMALRRIRRQSVIPSFATRFLQFSCRYGKWRYYC